MNYASIFLGIGLALFGGYLVTQQDFTAPYGKSYTDVELIKEGEGYRACTYLDTVGIKTVCYGFNLERGDSKSRVQAAGGDCPPLVTPVDGRYTRTTFTCCSMVSSW